ncbi:Disease resistance protein RML1B [Spatholobus suberectus]|nr:Disease resistance protein RML1B [Spatholobus suberectus]
MIQMHDLIQEMGLNIVRQGIEDPGKRSRLRAVEEVSDVLENRKGGDVVQGLKLDLSQIKDLHLNADTFNMMTNLRILKLYIPSGERSGNVHYSGVLSKLSCKLRYLEWSGCHLKSLPATFCAKMLVEICMPHSHITELWQGVQDVVNLVRIDLSECKHLKKLPDLSKASKLKWVNLSGCGGLCGVNSSVFSFDTLETLILDGCKKVKSLKSEKHLTSLKMISVNGCTSLREFSVSSDSITSLDLSSTGIEMLDSSIGLLRSLESLNVQGLGHGNLPIELFSLKDLEELRICNCRPAIDKQKLHVLFDGSTDLRLLHLKDCCNLCELPDNISGLSKLYGLRLDGSCVKTLPASIKHLNNLETLSLENCGKLGSLPVLPPSVTRFNAVNCRSLRTVSTLKTFAVNMTGKGKFISFQNCVGLDEPSLHCIMEGAHLAISNAVWQNIFVKGYGANTKFYNYNFVKVCFPGSRVPGLFKYRTTHSTINIDLPSSQSDFVGLIFCAVLTPSPAMKNLGAKIWCQCYLADGTEFGLATTSYHEVVTGLNSDHVFIWCDSSHFDSILKVYDTAERQVSFEFFITNDKDERVTIGTRECGVCLLFDSEKDFRHPIREAYVRVLGLELESQHSATSMATEMSDENDCNDK